MHRNCTGMKSIRCLLSDIRKCEPKRRRPVVHRQDLVNDALLMAIWKSKPQIGLVWHTDRGSQYASDSHRAVLKEHQVIQSMSRKGNCWEGLLLGLMRYQRAFFIP